jgi:signal transduction histidine kinase/CheY-like chemotaxis protein
MPDKLDLFLKRLPITWNYSLGYALVDQNLTVLTNNVMIHRWITGEFRHLIGESIVEFFPELVGLEDDLGQLVHNQNEVLYIPKIYRPSTDKEGRYFDLQIEPVSYFGPLLMITTIDATAEAHLELRLRHERNELRLSIQERQKAESALQQAKDELEIIVAERTAELKAANESLRLELEERKRVEAAKIKLEEQLHQAQKMEAIGRLAGGVAHDFNNLLTAIMGYATLAIQTLSATHPAYKNIQGIHTASDRAAHLTRQLLTFARRQVFEPKTFNLNDLILNVEKMLRRLINENIELITLLTPDVGLVKADPHQIEQVVVNLVVNARDAMTEGGKLLIETANVVLNPEYESHLDVIPGDYVRLTVSDTGVGMTPEVKSRLFEPFFTTKELDKGTGLGLATCFGIIKQSGGYIEADSEWGQGASFKVYLPQVSREVSSQPARPEATGELPHGNEKILLVEDETAVRELAASTLRRQGYVVLEAANGEEALRVTEAQASQMFQLLVTDVIMPRLGGKVLADRLRQAHPELKVLFISGYADDMIIHYNEILTPGIAFLQKPFSPPVLVRKVREVLDK